MALLKNIPKTVINPIGSFFKEARLAKGYSIEFVALHAAIESIDELEQFENNECFLGLDRIYALSNVLDISPCLITDWVDYFFK